MTATTINADYNDTFDIIQYSGTVAGGTPGSKGVQVIIDWSKVPGNIEASILIGRVADSIAKRNPAPAS